MGTIALDLAVDSGVATIRFARPAALNALDTATKEQLLEALAGVAADTEVRCLVITGSGRAFCTGQDLREHATNLAARDPAEVWATVVEHYNPIAVAIAELDKPVVAAVNGVAAGAGASIAFLTDYRLVASSATFHLAFSAVGLSCDTGCSWTLPRLVGMTRAMDLLLHPRSIPAGDALAMGIASEVVEDAAFPDRVDAIARRLAQGPTLAYAALRRAVGYSATHSLAESLAFEAERMRETGSSADHRAAVAAFLAKQPPTFEGR